MVASLTPLECPREMCGFDTVDRSRGPNSTMGRHIQSTHPTRRVVKGCPTCARDTTASGRSGMPNHDASYRCESGWYPHCSCDTCF